MSGFTGSHFSSGCESGWTGYFQESFETEGRFMRRSSAGYGGEREEEEEGDLSMISDASSGPRNVYYEENCQSVRRSGGNSTAAKSKMGRRNQHSCLDDTATSPVFGLSKRETDPYPEESFAEKVKEISESQSRKPHGKKQTSFFPSSSTKKLPKN